MQKIKLYYKIFLLLSTIHVKELSYKVRFKKRDSFTPRLHDISKDQMLFSDFKKKHYIIKNIVLQYYPQYLNTTPEIQEWLLSYPEHFDSLYLMEQTIAMIGGYEFVNEQGYDFNDKCKSDLKTVSISINGRRGSAVSYAVTPIRNVKTKIGPIRLAVYNIHTDEMMYYVMEPEFYRTLIDKTDTIKLYYNRQLDGISRIEHCRKKDIVEFAKYLA